MKVLHGLLRSIFNPRRIITQVVDRLPNGGLKGERSQTDPFWSLKEGGSMRKADIVVALLFLLVGIAVVIDSVNLGFMWGRTGPETGFFPFYLGAGMIIGSLIVLFNAVNLYRKQGAGKRLMPEGALRPILWVIIPSAAMVLITELVGLHIAAALYLGFYMRAVGKIGWTTTLLISIIAPLSLYITFDKLFLVPLPQGLWGGYLLRF